MLQLKCGKFYSEIALDCRQISQAKKRRKKTFWFNALTLTTQVKNCFPMLRQTLPFEALLLAYPFDPEVTVFHGNNAAVNSQIL